MNTEVLESRLARAEKRVEILERMLEDKARELFHEQESLRESNEQLEQLLATLGSAVIVTNSDLKILLVNNAAQSLFATNRDELIQRDIAEILHISGHSFRNDNGTPNEVALNQTEVIIQRPNGNNIPVLITISLLWDSKKAFHGLVVLAQDFSERKTLERQLVQSQKLEAVGQLAAGVAHEINTPIQYVRDNTMFFRDEFSNIQKLLDLFTKAAETSSNNASLDPALAYSKEIDLPYLLEEIPQALTQSLEGIENVIRIVRSMREFSHPGADEKGLVDINASLESTITVSKNEWKYVSDIEFQPANNLPLVPCLAGQMNQVFLNLIINAAHAVSEKTNEGKFGKGKITVSTHSVTDGIEILIRDTGAGIPVAVREKIFDPFFTTKKVGKGSGQGLAIAYHAVVDAHHGKLSFESEVGVGTTFHVFLPTSQ